MTIWETLLSIDWQTIGAMGLTAGGIILTVVHKFKKWVGDVEQLKKDSTNVNDYLKNGKAIISEISRLRNDNAEFKKIIKELVVEIKKNNNKEVVVDESIPKV